jgi:hypothetical protein
MSEVKVNKISPRSGTTVTLGDSGDTFTIPSGATINNQGTATNFGATGSASWTTTVKTSGFTAVAGEGYFVDTSSGAVSVNLPAGTAGAVVAFKDYLNSFDTHALTLVANGSDKIGGSTVNATLETEGIAVTLVFIDSTQGWLVTDSGLQSEAPTAQFIAATGGTTATCGNFKIHTFTGPGTFCVSNAGNPAGSDIVDYLVVAGGGGGASTGAGGGAGGARFFASPDITTYPASPNNAPAGLPVSVQGYPITVGGAGTAGPSTPGPQGGDGGCSGFSTITSTGGGGGGGPSSGTRNGRPGGSGGGVGRDGGPSGVVGAGNTPVVSPPQGNPGGTSPTPGYSGGGGGGGFMAVGGNAQGGPPAGVELGGNGGAGGGFPQTFVSTNGVCSSSERYFAGGGGGGANGDAPTAPSNGQGGLGGGGRGSIHPGGIGPRTAESGTTNTGGGGGGTGSSGEGPGAGGSGIVIIRYKFQ